MIRNVPNGVTQLQAMNEWWLSLRHQVRAWAAGCPETVSPIVPGHHHGSEGEGEGEGG